MTLNTEQRAIVARPMDGAVKILAGRLDQAFDYRAALVNARDTVVALALGVPKDALRLKSHIVRPTGALAP